MGIFYEVLESTAVRLMNRRLFADLATQVASAEKVAVVPEGLEALVFTADGDMRHALNGLQVSAARRCVFACGVFAYS